MKSALLRAVLASALTLASAAALAQAGGEGDLVKALKEGGLVVVVRHGAQETARLGFGDPETSFDFTEGGQVVSPAENNRRAAAMKKAAATPPGPGTNTFIVSHKPNVMDAFGKDWFDVKEGEASAFRPDGKGGFTLVGRILSEQWAGLAGKYPK